MHVRAPMDRRAARLTNAATATADGVANERATAELKSRRAAVAPVGVTG